MSSSNVKLVGFWKFRSNRILREDGDWHFETIFGGGMAFSEAGNTTLFVRTDQGCWGYSGRYRFEDNTIKITVEVAVANDLAGSTIERKIEFITDTEFLYSGLETHTNRPFEVIFYK